jgi:hypothetical protein
MGASHVVILTPADYQRMRETPPPPLVSVRFDGRRPGSREYTYRSLPGVALAVGSRVRVPGVRGVITGATVTATGVRYGGPAGRLKSIDSVVLAEGDSRGISYVSPELARAKRSVAARVGWARRRGQL